MIRITKANLTFKTMTIMCDTYDEYVYLMDALNKGKVII